MHPHRSLLVVACAASALLLGGPAAAGTAHDQLVDLCRQGGGDCNTAVPDVPPPAKAKATPRQPAQPPAVNQLPALAPRPLSVQDQLAIGVASRLIQGLFFAPPPATPSGPAPEELALIEQQRIAAFQARAAAVAQQRAARDARQASNMDSMAAAMSSGSDGPTAGSGTSVALQGTTPGLFDPPSYSLAGPAPSPAADRLARMAAENQDVAVLTQRLAELSARLEAARREADLVRRSSLLRTEDYLGMERSLTQGVTDAQERGMSMAFDGLFAANGKALQMLSEVQASGRAWRELKGLLHEAHGGLEVMHDTSEKLGQWSDDAAFATRQRAFKEDVVYLAKRLGGPYADLGGSIVASARTVREELAILHRQGELDGFEKAYQARLDRVHGDMAGLIAQVKNVRTQLASRTGIAASDIALPSQPHRGLGAEVPSLAE